MHTEPKKSRTQVDDILLEQFRRKGYKCQEIEQQDATIFILTHEKKVTDTVTPVISEAYKDLFRAN
ncbi:MAG: hypothetical protein J7502_08500 [Flavisolibacter sp.]|nr:hypothetical protein [Flavisolibacter sp.]